MAMEYNGALVVLTGAALLLAVAKAQLPILHGGSGSGSGIAGKVCQ